MATQQEETKFRHSGKNDHHNKLSLAKSYYSPYFKNEKRVRNNHRARTQRNVISTTATKSGKDHMINIQSVKITIKSNHRLFTQSLDHWNQTIRYTCTLEAAKLQAYQWAFGDEFEPSYNLVPWWSVIGMSDHLKLATSDVLDSAPRTPPHLTSPDSVILCKFPAILSYTVQQVNNVCVATRSAGVS